MTGEHKQNLSDGSLKNRIEAFAEIKKFIDTIDIDSDEWLYAITPKTMLGVFRETDIPEVIFKTFMALLKLHSQIRTPNTMIASTKVITEMSSILQQIEQGLKDGAEGFIVETVGCGECDVCKAKAAEEGAEDERSNSNIPA